MARARSETSMLIVIDTQPGFYRERGDVDPELFDRFVDRVAWLVSVAAALRVPIIATVEHPERNGAIADQVAAALPAGTATFEKVTFDLSAEWAIRSAVDATARATALLVGMETDVCVAQSAMGLAEIDLRVLVAADATFAPGEAHAHGLERLRGIGAELVSAKGIFYEWLASLTELREFKHAHPALARPPGIQL